MRRFIAFCLLSFYLFSTTEVHELLRLPLLVEHFKEHQQKDLKISFSRFLSNHYSYVNTKNSSDKKDMELPFKSHDSYHGNQYISILIHIDYQLPQITSWVQSRKTTIYNPPLYSNKALDNIWQPPKIC